MVTNMNAIEIKNLNKEYKDFSLTDMSLTVPAGSVVGLIGENGAGKSTTIKLLLNMTHRDSGEIYVLGKSNLDKFNITKNDIGVVFDEVDYPDMLNAKQINKIMKYTYKNWEEQQYFSFLKRFNLPENKSFKDFSRGMKMKLGITIALCHHAKLLILDEATSGLDPVVRDEIIDILGDFTRDEKHSILISSHIVSDLEKLCDYIAFLHQGKLVLFEEKDTLLEKYCLVNCTKEQLKLIEPTAVKGKKVGKYGVQAIVEKTKVIKGLETSPISLEELFVFMVRGSEL